MSATTFSAVYVPPRSMSRMAVKVSETPDARDAWHAWRPRARAPPSARVGFLDRHVVPVQDAAGTRRHIDHAGGAGGEGAFLDGGGIDVLPEEPVDIGQQILFDQQKRAGYRRAEPREVGVGAAAEVAKRCREACVRRGRRERHGGDARRERHVAPPQSPPSRTARAHRVRHGERFAMDRDPGGSGSRASAHATERRFASDPVGRPPIRSLRVRRSSASGVGPSSAVTSRSRAESSAARSRPMASRPSTHPSTTRARFDMHPPLPASAGSRGRIIIAP